MEIPEYQDRTESAALKRIDAFSFEVYPPEGSGYPGSPGVQSRLNEGIFRLVCKNYRKTL